MGKPKKKKSGKASEVAKLNLAAAILNLIAALLVLLKKLTD